MQDATNHKRNITYQMHDKATTFQVNLEKEYQLRQPNPDPHPVPSGLHGGLGGSRFLGFFRLLGCLLGRILGTFGLHVAPQWPWLLNHLICTFGPPNHINLWKPTAVFVDALTVSRSHECRKLGTVQE